MAYQSLCATLLRILTLTILLPIAYAVAIGIILPLLLILLPPLFLTRWSVSRIVPFFNPKIGRMLDPLATIHHVFGPGHVAVPVNVVEGVPDVDHIRQEFQSKILNARRPLKQEKLLYPELTQSVTRKFGYYFWSNENSGTFDICKNIRMISEEEAGGFGLSHRFDFGAKCGKSVIKNVHRIPVQKGGTLWSVHIIPNVKGCHSSSGTDDDDDRPYFALLCRFHHVLGEARSFAAMCQKISNAEVKPEMLSARSAGKNSMQLPWIQNLVAVVKSPYDLTLSLLDGSWTPPKFLKDGEIENELATASSSHTLSLAQLRDVAQTQSGTVTSVLLSVFVTALRRYTATSLADEQVFNVNVIMPFPNPPERLRNVGSNGPVAVPLSSRSHQDTVDLFRTVAGRIRHLKVGSSLPLLNWWTSNMTGALPLPLLSPWLRKLPPRARVLGFVNTVFSPIPASPFGYKLHAVWAGGGTVRGTRVVLFYAVSYEDEIRLSLLSDAGVLDETLGQQIVDSVVEDFYELKNLPSINSTKEVYVV